MTDPVAPVPDTRVLAAWMILLCAVGRIVPHPPNFAPVGAVGVLAGRTMTRARAIAITLAAMLLSDAALSAIHGWPLLDATLPFRYAGFAAYALLAHALRGRRGGALAAAGLGAVAFFLLSNLGVWASGAYGYTAAGLEACYVAAIPFFGRTLAGDLLWTVALVLAFRAVAARAPRRWVGAAVESPAL